MAQNPTQVRCPNCGNLIQARIEQIIDVGADPSAKGRLLSGSLNVVSCPVCGFQGQLPTPLVYHDPDKELLLTFVPMEAGLSKDEQERRLGALINRVIDRLPSERRKAYLLQPKATLTVQGLIDQVLEADGVTKEDLEAQQRKLQLFEELVRTPEGELEKFVQEHDDELDRAFFQLASLAIQAAGDQGAAQAASQKLDAALAKTKLGQKLAAQQQELRAAAESLQQAGDSLTREKLLDLIVDAPGDERVIALVNLARQGMDYVFFQKLSEKIEVASGEEKDRLMQLRDRVLEITSDIDRVQEARAAEAAALLQALAQADNLDEAVQAALPAIDELFLATLEANLAAARERDDQEAVQKLEAVQGKIEAIVQESLPEGLKLAQKVLGVEDEGAAMATLEEGAEHIDDQLLNSLYAAIGRLEELGHKEDAERIRRLHRQALRIKMRREMAGGAQAEA